MKLSELLVEYLELRDDAKDEEFVHWSRQEHMTELLADMDKLIEGTTP